MNWSATPVRPYTAQVEWADMWTLVQPAIVESLIMFGLVAGICIVLGLPLGAFLFNTSAHGLHPNRLLYRSVGWVVNVAWSLPFLIIAAAIIPFTRLLVGTTIGIAGAVVPLSVAMVPYFARLVEAALREVPPEVIDVARASGGNRFQTIIHVQLTEALPALFSAFTVLCIGIIAYSAIAGAVGAGGIGNLAITYGYQRFDDNVMLVTVVLLALFAQLVQLFGGAAVRWARRA